MGNDAEFIGSGLGVVHGCREEGLDFAVKIEEDGEVVEEDRGTRSVEEQDGGRTAPKYLWQKKNTPRKRNECNCY
jgi:hypothetical protein